MSEIKLSFCALAGCTSHKTVHPEIATCTLPIYSNDKWLKKNVHTPGAHLLKSCTRRWKCAHRVQGAPLISDTARTHIFNCSIWLFSDSRFLPQGQDTYTTNSIVYCTPMSHTRTDPNPTQLDCLIELSRLVWPGL